MSRLNAGDVTGVLALFRDDAVLEPGGPGGGGRCPGGRCAGKEAIRLQVQGQISDEHQLKFVSESAAGERTSGRYELRSRMTRARQVERIVFSFALDEKEGRIASLSFQPDLTDGLTATFFEGRQQP